jgi:hypothetical protein
MNTKSANERSKISEVAANLRHVCLRSCQKIVAQLGRVKAAIGAQARATLPAHESMLKLALNEAEAQAWQTAYPHLLFPTLAMEKVQAIVDWAGHQQFVQGAKTHLGPPAS